jgi:aryl-alcohol dehydrogenase-like predicted oxidoreductase
MKNRQLGDSDLNVPVVSFGAWAVGGWRWGGTDDAAAVRAINRAIDLGMTCIDTAAVYGQGHSETVVGKAVAGRRDEVVIATKCGLRWDCDDGELSMESIDNDGKPIGIYHNLRPESVKYEVDQSLLRLGIDRIDLYQCHWPDAATPLDETMGVLAELQQQGKIRHIGLSNFAADMVEKCMSMVSVVSVQSRYNALDRNIEQDLLPFCRDHGIGVLTYSSIAQGLLSGKVTMDRVFPETDLRSKKRWFTPENRKRILDMLSKIQPIADAHGATLAQVAISWLTAQPGVTTALVGARNEQQVEENVQAADIELADDELRVIRTAVEEVGGPV